MPVQPAKAHARERTSGNRSREYRRPLDVQRLGERVSSIAMILPGIDWTASL